MAIEDFKKINISSDIRNLIDLISSIGNQSENKRRRHRNNINSYKSMMQTADTPAEFNNILTLLADDISMDDGENFEEYSNLGIDINQRKDALDIAKGLPSRIDSVKAKWEGLNFEELTLNDVKKLKSDFISINDDYNNVAYNFAKKGVIPPSILPLSAINNMNFINTSYDASIGDLMKTDKITPDDWMIIQNTPELLEDIRDDRLRQYEKLYNKYSPMLNDFNRVNQEDLDVAINSATITPLLQPFIKDAITGEVNELEESTLLKAIEGGDRLGLAEFANRKRNEVKQIVKHASEQISFWGEKGQTITGDETTDDKNKILNSLFSSDSVNISENYLSDGKYFTDNLGKVHEVVKNDDGTYKLSMSNDKNKKISINNASSLPEIGISLWNNLDEYAGYISLKEEDVNILNERGFGNFIQDNVGGHSITTFMKQLRKLDKQLQNSKSKVIELLVDKSKKIIDLGEDWSGLKDIDDFKQLSEILKSQKYKIDGIWNNNIYSKGFNNLESNLYRTSSK